MTDFDTVLTRLINGATDFIERECGKTGLESFPNDGHFIQKTYTNEVYSVRGTKQIYLPLPQRAGHLSHRYRKSDARFRSRHERQPLASASLPECRFTTFKGSFHRAPQSFPFPEAGALTMSQQASVSQSGAVFEISGLISFQWRSGTPSNPNWTSFITDQFELAEQGYSGIVRVYGVMPRIYNNMLRATYVAGYPYNWANAGDGKRRTSFPADLTNLCENLVVRIFKRRQLDGKASENIAGRYDLVEKRF